MPDEEAVEQPETTMPDVETALGDCELFRDLTSEQVRELAPAFHVERYKAGEAIFEQGSLGQKIYVVNQGQVRLERVVHLGGSTEARVVVSILGRCRLLGCWACILGQSRELTESAVCQKPTVVLSAKGVDLRAIMDGDHQLAVAFMERLCFMLGDKVSDVYSATAAL